MRVRGPLLCLLAALLAAGCGASAAPPGQGRPRPTEWRVGFWAWQHSWGARYLPLRDVSADDLYVQGKVQSWPGQLLKWPEGLPAARKYWLLWRFETQSRPIDQAPPASLAPQYAAFLQDARSRALDVAGLQVDFDCPTGRLHDYAAWLARLRKQLPPGTRLSVTALLDWFRPGTASAEVIREVDEFVPQFYDAGRPSDASMTIAEPIDAGRWAALFNRFEVPYRIGISSFGRVRVGRDVYPLGPTLLQLLASPAFDSPVRETTPAGERRLTLRARATTTVDGTRFEAGQRVEIVLPTSDSVARAYSEARKMGGYCGGVVFFRWPATDETALLSPAAVSRAIGRGSERPLDDRLEVVPGDCAAVRCSDLYLLPGEQFPDQPRTTVLRSSVDLEYFLPQANVGRVASMTARDTITVRLPALHGETRLYLGRVMSKKAASFAVGGPR